VIGILFAARMRNLARFTFADVLASRQSPVASRRSPGPMRAFAATSATNSIGQRSFLPF